MDFTIFNKYDFRQVESEVIKLFCSQNSVIVLNPFLQNLLLPDNVKLHNELIETLPVWNVKDIERLFESLLDKGHKKSNGIVFTPEYIANRIISDTMKKAATNSKVIDPSCGSGAFLLPAVNYLSKKLRKKPKFIIENLIFGLDLDEHNVRRTKILLNLLLVELGYVYTDDIKLNIFQLDSLKNDWFEVTNSNDFDFIIGNPPYVNSHDLDKSVLSYLKSNFETMKIGTTNIFYAFVEKSMEYLSPKGELGFIVPNNFLTIKAATNLRTYLVENNYLKMILNFGENMVFKPVMTYNCLLYLNKKEKRTFKYQKIDKVSQNEIENTLHKTSEFYKLSLADLDNNKWKLGSKITIDNLVKIEKYDNKIGRYIKTGIATLRDKYYIVDGYDKAELKYYKILDNEKFYLENELVKPLYKVSAIRDANDVEKSVKYIIFPYKEVEGKNVIIPIGELMKKYPNVYKYFVSIQDILKGRFKKEVTTWYEYGRSQGLNNIGYKLIHPTFSDFPKFIRLMDKSALFVNGYALTCSDDEIELFDKILNSNLMEYYINHTSYSIEGGFMCYQKRFLENFSIPSFSKQEIEFLSSESSKEKINSFLVKKYELDLVDL